MKSPTPLFTIPIFQMHPRTLLPERYRQNLSLMSYVSIFGMDVSDYSFGYIAGWSTGKDTKELKESLEIIRDTSNDIISKTEQTLTQMQSIEQTVSETIQPKRRGRCM